MEEIEKLREQIRSLGWETQEIAIYDQEPYNRSIVGWKVRGVKCREKSEAYMPSLLEALKEFYKLNRPLSFGPNDL